MSFGTVGPALGTSMVSKASGPPMLATGRPIVTSMEIATTANVYLIGVPSASISAVRNDPDGRREHTGRIGACQPTPPLRVHLLGVGADAGEEEVAMEKEFHLSRWRYPRARLAPSSLWLEAAVMRTRMVSLGVLIALCGGCVTYGMQEIAGGIILAFFGLIGILLGLYFLLYVFQVLSLGVADALTALTRWSSDAAPGSLGPIIAFVGVPLLRL